eukprot:6217570-Amphidinium_carterae.2
MSSPWKHPERAHFVQNIAIFTKSTTHPANSRTDSAGAEMPGRSYSASAECQVPKLPASYGSR